MGPANRSLDERACMPRYTPITSAESGRLRNTNQRPCHEREWHAGGGGLLAALIIDMDNRPLSLTTRLREPEIAAAHAWASSTVTGAQLG